MMMVMTMMMMMIPMVTNDRYYQSPRAPAVLNPSAVYLPLYIYIYKYNIYNIYLPPSLPTYLPTSISVLSV